MPLPSRLSLRLRKAVAGNPDAFYCLLGSQVIGGRSTDRAAKWARLIEIDQRALAGKRTGYKRTNLLEKSNFYLPNPRALLALPSERSVFGEQFCGYELQAEFLSLLNPGEMEPPAGLERLPGGPDYLLPIWSLDPTPGRGFLENSDSFRRSYLAAAPGT